MVEVKRATLADADHLFAMVREFATSYVPDRAAFDRTLPALLVRADDDVLIAKDEEGAVGYALAVDMPTLFANGAVTEVVELYVRPRSRNKGLGKLLMEDVANAARDRGSKEVVVPTRRAADFYDAIGFERTAEYFKLKL